MQNIDKQIEILSEWEQKYRGPQKRLRSSADWYDIVYTRFEWEVDPAVSYIRGAVTSYFVQLTGNAEQIDFELSDRLTVDSVKRGNEHLAFNHRNNNLLITRATGDPTVGPLDSLTVFYQGSPANTGFGAFTTTYTAWQKPVLWTLSEPYGAAEWWPCKQTLNDKIDSVDIFVTVPPDNKVASNGLLISETEQNGQVVFHWKHRYPIAAYLVAIAVTDYDAFSYTVPLSTGHLSVLNYVYPEKREEWERATSWVTNELQYYDSLFIPYPFMREKYGHAQFNWGGGMEHQTMSFMADLGTWLTSHELAHQWFGNYITCGSWSDIWLNEGFATYLTGLYFERFEPNAWDGWKAGQVNYICSSPSGSVYVYDTSSVNRIFDGRLSYSKAAMVLHMLRKELGDEAFFSGIRSYLADEALRHDYALTSDLQFHLEQAAGRSLDYFFTDWIYRQGYPAIHLNWNASDNLVAIEAEQRPSHPSVERFRLRIPVRLSGEGRDTIVLLNLNQEKQLFFFTPSFRVDSLLPDPGHDYIARYTTMQTGRYHPDLSEIQVYPNPSAGMFQIRFKEALHLPVVVRMTDVAGREVRVNISGSFPGNAFTIDASGLASGTYLLLLDYSEKTVPVPVMKY